MVTALVDTSVWVDHLRAAGPPAHVNMRSLLTQHEPDVATTEPICRQLLAGPTSERGAAAITRLVDGLALLAVEPALDYRSAAAIYRATRRQGRAVRNLSDCLIAAVAIRSEATLISKEADFESIVDVTSLRHEPWR